MWLIRHFNSIKLQLEPEVAYDLTKHIIDFNSIKLQLEPEVAYDLTKHIIDFNSIKLQLEPAHLLATVAPTTISIP